MKHSTRLLGSDHSIVGAKVVPFVLVVLLFGCGLQSASAEPPPITLRVASDGDFLAFTPTELSCPAGARVRLIFQHTGSRIPQDHNWVLVLPGSSDEIIRTGAEAGENANYVPADNRVLAATPLCGPGAEAIVEFTAPPPGDYPFLCTYPGHGAVMRGVLHTLAPDVSKQPQ